MSNTDENSETGHDVIGQVYDATPINSYKESIENGQ